LFSDPHKTHKYTPYRAVNTLPISYKTSQLMLYREIIAVCSKTHTKHKCFNVKPGGTQSNHWDFMGKILFPKIRKSAAAIPRPAYLHSRSTVWYSPHKPLTLSRKNQPWERNDKSSPASYTKEVNLLTWVTITDRHNR
jgi:hypothetical protein